MGRTGTVGVGVAGAGGGAGTVMLTETLPNFDGSRVETAKM